MLARPIKWPEVYLLVVAVALPPELKGSAEPRDYNPKMYDEHSIARMRTRNLCGGDSARLGPLNARHTAQRVKDEALLPR